MVLKQVLARSRGLGQETLPLWFALAIFLAVLPDVLSVAFALLTSILLTHHDASGKTDDLRQEREKLEEELKLRREIGRLENMVNTVKIFREAMGRNFQAARKSIFRSRDRE